ncbi:hypothetical protein CONPUDRAFT_46132 [Coniophora puteana RWD-64-598 SS2]|uniref:RAVE complex protein Rav1 C-terminal domain-containing protein n=1 Tax=Coniophora puteana (strain RWD-64-598) TaxID=741705 RepID=A0A5M3N614_CONPW|nr:uncharacterized protein CONPUDRAFT_46132 [Coniophora puteana RWD-64-598 SS2]EIW86859.1 hypothetical protein CONPUDRAFT_46132 [Coniophora puteana RWD-64-598 SS2]
MLSLVRTFTGSPQGPLKHLVLPNATLILYPSADGVIILNAITLSLVRVLAFGELFPGYQHTKQNISCLVVDSALKLVSVAIAQRIAAWSLSGTQHDVWRVHSSLTLPGHEHITTLDCRSGLLAVGSQHALAVYTLILENDLPTWSKKWSIPITSPKLAHFSPSLMHIAMTSHLQGARVKIYSTVSGKMVQSIPHMRPVKQLIWRYSPKSRSDDPALLTVTSDSVLRIFLPVIDEPERLQLHGALDISSLQVTLSPPRLNVLEPSSQNIWLDKAIILDALTALLAQSQDDDERMNRVREIIDEDWDLFLQVLEDGSLIISAVANIDRRPPTLLRQFALAHLPAGTLMPLPSHLYLAPHKDPGCLMLVTSNPLAVYRLSLVPLLQGQRQGVVVSAKAEDSTPEAKSKVLRMVRTPTGHAVAVVREEGGEVWKSTEGSTNLSLRSQWTTADDVVVFESGKCNYLATYAQDKSLLTLHSDPESSIELPDVASLFVLPCQDHHACIFGLGHDLSIAHICVSSKPNPTLVLFSRTTLPLPSPPMLILPVDPMAWTDSIALQSHDALLGVSEQGQLTFWVPDVDRDRSWVCTGRVNTGRKNLRMARCSSAKKSVLVVPCQGEEELTIWDSKESEFASGLEFSKTNTDPINDLDWTSTPDGQSVLAIGFAHRIELICQQRKTYFDDEPGWATCYTIDLESIIPYRISDSIWLHDGSLLVAAGHVLCLYSQATASSDGSEGLFEHVARHNGVLPDYHPQMLLQCLLWGKLELVKDVIVKLGKSMDDYIADTSNEFHWDPIPIDQYLQNNPDGFQSLPSKKYKQLFDGLNNSDHRDEEPFSRPTVTQLLEHLEEHPVLHLSPNEQASLLTLIQTALEVDEQRRALDANGLRYVTSMRAFYILNRRIVSDPGSPRSGKTISRQTGYRERLRYRDIIWAFHSESQELLLESASTACNRKMLWSDARSLGVFIWLNSVESMKSTMETIARNEYMAGNNRDPVACSLYYFALGKVKLVHGLWRQASWHKEQAMMLKFLNNDFTQPRWRTAALKNAYALLAKQRFEYAAAFFLLGDSLKAAVNICVKQLDDFQLAIALARIREADPERPILRDLLNNTVLPIAFQNGNRWLASWAFWLLHRRDMAVRVLLTPLRDLVTSLSITIEEVKESSYDDPSLALLFSQLRDKTLQAAKGTSEISGRAEFNFVLQMARVFRRMGCHALALDIVQSWSFERPSISTQPSYSVANGLNADGDTHAITRAKDKDSFSLHRRRSSMVIDMEIPSAPTTSPDSDTPPSKGLETIGENGDLQTKKASLGTLMKSAKRDVQVPEFNMNEFFP